MAAETTGAHSKRAPKLTDLVWWRLRRVHGWTNGLSTDVLNQMLLIGRRARNAATAISPTLKWNLAPGEARDCADEVRRNSHSILPVRLDPALCDELVSFCLSLNCMPYPCPRPDAAEIKLDLEQPVAPMNIYGLKQGVHGHRAISALMNDPALIAIARDYLGCEPILDTCQIWASPVFGDGPSSEAAQLFHYDMAHPRFIKFFIYLTDVDAESGPHCVVPTSHRRDVAGWKLRLNTKRIDDAVIEKAYPGMARELTGPKGTIIAEDTRAFHKGKHPKSRHRFVVELYFVNAVVGRNTPEPERLRWEQRIA